MSNDYLKKAKEFFTDWWNDDYRDFMDLIENLTLGELEKFCLYVFKITRSPERKKKELEKP